MMITFACDDLLRSSPVYGTSHDEQNNWYWIGSVTEHFKEEEWIRTHGTSSSLRHITNQTSIYRSTYGSCFQVYSFTPRYAGIKPTSSARHSTLGSKTT